ncbi:chemotaxis protein CheW [Candidatus Marithrix sp. Canyon 246]|uniref:chemotaxis protein CheW n=1 Tax=Candidatus Marithrix sp. Canyon 246 TaxID=1827136 RepID=UPI000849FE25|nr:chemotaxis protein CheW [Candidatus Marithrix sp. Canyon 246]
MLAPSQALNRSFLHQTDESIPTEEVSRRLGFLIGNLGFVIANKTMSELSEMLSISPIPFTANWFIGLMNLRGNLIPVFDLYKLLDFEHAKVKKPMLVILGENETAGAIVIHSLPTHLNFVKSEQLTHLPPLPAILQPYMNNGYDQNGQIWLQFDHLGFFQYLASKLTT